jgi:hypothetical protein
VRENRNLAMFAGNIDAIPFAGNLHDGASQIQDNGQFTTPNSKPIYLTITGSRTTADQWSTIPVTDDVALRLLRLAYRRAFGLPDSLYDDECKLANDLAHELKKSTVVVDDTRSTVQISPRQELAPDHETLEVMSAQREFVSTLLRVAREQPTVLNRVATWATGRENEFQRLARDFATAIGDRNIADIKTYGNKLASCAMNKANQQLTETENLATAVSNAEEHDRKPPGTTKDPKAHAQVYSGIKKFVDRLTFVDADNPANIRSAERAAAAEALFEVYRSWPEQSDLIGIRHREVSSYRIDDHKVLTSNHPKMIFPNEGKLHDGNLDFVELPTGSAHLIYVRRPCDSTEAATLRVRFVKREGGRFVVKDCYLDVWEGIEANQIQGEVDKLFEKGRVAVSGGPLMINAPIALSLVGDDIDMARAQLNNDRMINNDDCMSPIQVRPIYRYLKATPMVVEVRRQVMEVEHDLQEIHGGWVGCSTSKHDIPANACYTSSWRDCGVTRFVWVTPEGRKEFEDFTIKILNLSALIKDVTFTGTSGLKFTPTTVR